MEASFDGSQLIFAMRAPEIEDVDDEDQPRWNIWEYDVPTDTLTRIITSDITAEDGHDIAPHYLPTGDIIFSSTRQRAAKAILLDESKPQFEAQDEDRDEPAFLLHVINGVSGAIKQVSFNQSHDTDPTVLSDGKVVFTRWDNMGGRNTMNLYRMNPDGTELELLYGLHSHNTGTDESAIQFDHPREMPDGRIMVIMRPNVSTDFAGDIVAIDVDNYIDNEMPVASNLGATTSAQESLTLGVITTDNSISSAGRYSTVFPLDDGSGRIIVGWNQCRLIVIEDDVETIRPCTDALLAEADPVEAAPLSVLKVYDPSEGTEKPILVPEENVFYSEVVALQEKSVPSIIHEKTAGAGLDADAFAESVGILHIRSVYDFAGIFDDLDNGGSGAESLTEMMDPTVTAVANRTARFLRIVKGVSLPDRNVDDLPQVPGNVLGADGQQMKEIIGYTTIEPDGSVRVKVPANIPFILGVLDGNGRRLGTRHKNWLVVRPGEEVECSGCHTTASVEPHGRPEAEPASLNTGAATDGFTFPNTDSAIFADMGDTMAQALTRIQPDRLTPTMDIVFEDLWTDETVQAKEPSFTWGYDDINYVAMGSSAPTTDSCIAGWSGACRSVINYEEHVHPIWTFERIVLDPNDSDIVLSNHTCVACHNVEEADTDSIALLDQLVVNCRNEDRLTETGLLSQLNLTDADPTNPDDRYNSYLELRAGDNELAYVDGVLQDRIELVFDAQGAPVFVDLDGDGELDLDVDGNPIQATTTVGVGGSTNAGSGARNSTQFFDIFESTGCHPSWLNGAELRVMSEWLDLGGQYYNNPFDVPQD